MRAPLAKKIFINVVRLVNMSPRFERRIFAALLPDARVVKHHQYQLWPPRSGGT